MVTMIQARSNNFQKDARLINCYVEFDPQENDYWVIKRPGYIAYQGLGDGAGRGIFSWTPYNVIGGASDITVVGDEFFKNGALIDNIGGVGRVYFEPMLEGPYLVTGSASGSAYFFDGTTLTEITDVNFPVVDRCPGFAYLNGRIYVIRYDGAIQGSDTGDPSAWNATNVIIARNNPDQGVGILRQLSYIVALKEWTTEFFEDVGNPTGSLLKPVEGAILDYGCANFSTVAEMDGNIFWVATNKGAAPSVVMLDKLSLSIISTPQIDRFLKLISNFATADVNAFPLKIGGHRFYVLSVGGLLDVSLVYDVDQKFWQFWNDVDGLNAWPFGFSSDTIFADNSLLLQRYDNGAVVQVDASYTYSTDNGIPAPVHIYTPNFDFGTIRSKQLNMMTFKGDQVSGSEMDVQFTDDDYQTWSNYRSVDLSIKDPRLDNWGSFIRRAYHYRHNKPTPFRMKSTDLQIDIGTY